MSGLILASRSAARRAMLGDLGLRFEAADAGVDEGAIKDRMLAEGATPAAVAQALADEKALAVSRVRPGLVLGADQTLEHEGRLHDKATSLAEARARLIQWRGGAHVLHSAAALAEDGRVVWRGTDSARMAMRDFSDAFLDAYLAQEGEAALSSVGCYRLEGPGAQLFDAVQGDYFTVLGLPLWAVLAELRRRGAIAS